MFQVALLCGLPLSLVALSEEPSLCVIDLLLESNTFSYAAQSISLTVKGFFVCNYQKNLTWQRVALFCFILNRAYCAFVRFPCCLFKTAFSIGNSSRKPNPPYRILHYGVNVNQWKANLKVGSAHSLTPPPKYISLMCRHTRAEGSFNYISAVFQCTNSIVSSKLFSQIIMDLCYTWKFVALDRSHTS